MPPTTVPQASLVLALLAAIAPSAIARTSDGHHLSKPPHRPPPAHHNPHPQPHPHRRPKGPSAARIRAAVRAAERSHGLWATVNLCDTPRYPNTIGIRGQMPALGFPTAMSMRIQLQYWSRSSKRFKRDPYAAMVVRLGTASRGFYQGGVIYTFRQRVLLRALVTFRWYYRGRLLARVTRLTGGGDRHVDYSDPPGYSRASCRIG